MPTRMLRDWTDSEKINSLSPQAEVFFVRLMMKADDFGCFHATPQLLKSALFPFKADLIHSNDLIEWLNECEKAGLIIVYEVDNKKYLKINNFGQRLRSPKPKFPACGQMSATCGQMSADCQQPADKCRPEEEEEEEEEEEIDSEVEGEEEGKKSSPPKVDVPTLNIVPKKGKINARDCPEVISSMKTDEIMIQTVCMQNRISTEKADELINDFFSHNASVKKEWSNEGEVRAHFINWIPKKLLNSEKTDGKQLKPTSSPVSGARFGQL